VPVLPADIERAFREQHGRAVATWPAAGLPPSPAGWIITTARNRVIDRLRREASRQDRQAQSSLLHARDEPPEEGPVHDDRLLMAIAPSPVVALNRIVAVAEVQGPGAALPLLERLDLDGYHLLHAVRGDLLGRLGRDDEAAIAYRAAIDRSENAAERDSLERRLRS
jgi:predicted RNA polymerase sigma factor